MHTARVTLIIFLLVANSAVHAAPAAELWPVWLDDNPNSATTVDHAPWQEFLDRYLRPSEDGVNRVAYGEVTAADRALLIAYLDALTTLDPRDLSRAEQFPYWINLYNALTVEVVLRHPRKGSILRMGKGLFSIGPWGDSLIKVAGVDLSLDDIEHRILRPIWKDHRIHYAVNCASIGCPNLAREAYTPENTERLLAQGETDYVNHDRGVSLDGRLRLSSIYKWYRSDFGETEQDVLSYLARHRPELAEQLNAHTGRVDYRYDWNLNRTQ